MEIYENQHGFSETDLRSESAAVPNYFRSFIVKNCSHMSIRYYIGTKKKTNKKIALFRLQKPSFFGS